MALASVFLLAALFFSSRTLASNVALSVLDKECGALVGQNLELLHDPTGKMTAQEAAEANLWHKSDNDIPNLGVQPGAQWVRLTLTNPGTKPEERFLVVAYPPLDYLSLFTINPDGGVEERRAGDLEPQPGTSIPHREYVFRVTLPPGATRTVYLRAANVGAMTIPVRLWTPREFFLEDHKSQMGLGIILGMVAALALHFLFQAKKLRHQAPFWFSLYLGSLGAILAVSKGYLQEFQGPLLAPYSNFIQVGIVSLLYFTGAKFFRVYLNLRHSWPRIDRVMRGLQYLALLMTPALLYPSPFKIPYSIVIFGLGPLFSMTAAIVLWKRGSANAGYFALAWLFAHILGIADFLRIYAILPVTPIFYWLLPLVTVLSAMFFTRAMTAQIVIFQIEASTDPLTGLANRRELGRFLEVEWRRQTRHARPIALILSDLDDFKAFNDRHGHPAGDRCLMAVAGVFKDLSRRMGELAVRYGGEEFLLVVSDCDEDRALALARELGSRVSGLCIEHPGSPWEKVTLSMGVVSRDPRLVSSPAKLLEMADQALYQAKDQGKNQVVVWNRSRETQARQS